MHLMSSPKTVAKFCKVEFSFHATEATWLLAGIIYDSFKPLCEMELRVTCQYLLNKIAFLELHELEKLQKFAC